VTYVPAESRYDGTSQNTSRRSDPTTTAPTPLGSRRVAFFIMTRSVTVERLTIQRVEHVGIVVGDLAAAAAFFVACEVEDEWREKEG
jgi:hypothetical protein